MKIKPTKKITRRYLLWGAIVLGVLALGVTGFYWANSHLSNDNNIDYTQPTEEQKKSGTEKKKETIESDPPKSSGETDTPPTPIPQPNGKDKIDMAITATNQDGSILQIRALIYGVVDGGTCTLTLTRDSMTITRNASVQSLANSATCEGFDIPAGELSAGTWTASISFENSTLTGNTSQEVIIQ